MSTRFAAVLASPPPCLPVASCFGGGYDDEGAAKLPGAFRVARSRLHGCHPSSPLRAATVVEACGGVQHSASTSMARNASAGGRN